MSLCVSACLGRVAPLEEEGTTPAPPSASGGSTHAQAAPADAAVHDAPKWEGSSPVVPDASPDATPLPNGACFGEAIAGGPSWVVPALDVAAGPLLGNVVMASLP